MSFWELNISPFLGITGSALVAWGVLRASRREAKTAEEESAKRREEYFRKSVDEQRRIIENLADEQRSTTQSWPTTCVHRTARTLRWTRLCVYCSHSLG